MCGDLGSGYRAQTSDDKSEVARKAGIDLARLMERQLGYDNGHIDNIALRLFIRAHWKKVAQLAHAIHDEG